MPASTAKRRSLSRCSELGSDFPDSQAATAWRDTFIPSDCRKAFRKAIGKAKIDPKGLTAHHTARHTACTLAAEQTDDVRTLQAVGRWKSLAMVQKYFHADGRRSKAALRRI